MQGPEEGGQEPGGRRQGSARQGKGSLRNISILVVSSVNAESDNMYFVILHEFVIPNTRFFSAGSLAFTIDHKHHQNLWQYNFLYINIDWKYICIEEHFFVFV